MIQMPHVPLTASIDEVAARVRKDDPYLVDYLLGWSGHKEPQPWGAATGFALEVAHAYGLIVSESDPQLTGLGCGVVRQLAEAA